MMCVCVCVAVDGGWLKGTTMVGGDDDADWCETGTIQLMDLDFRLVIVEHKHNNFYQTQRFSWMLHRFAIGFDW